MCFSESQSYIHAIVLFVTGIMIKDKWELSISLIFLGFKDLLQGLLYHYLENKDKLNFYTSLSWVHICFQPLFVNLISSYFDKENKIYWNRILFISLIYGIYASSSIKEFDMTDSEMCIKKNKTDDFCSKETTSYLGTYHIAYKFNRNSERVLPRWWYMLLVFVPSIFSNSKVIGILWLFFVGLIEFIFRHTNSGERGAIWCYLSIIFALPLAIFSDKLELMMKN